MGNKKKQSTASVLYVSHGGGPLPLLGDKSHSELVRHLQYLPGIITRPSAIVVISAHWEEPLLTVTSGKHPPLIYDYYGFPPESYQIEYPAPGHPDLASEIYDLLLKNGIQAKQDAARGFDHGLFIPLKLMFPQADIPCLQLSLVRGLDAELHTQVGNALRPLLRKDILIIGSGFSFHNLRAFFSPVTADSTRLNEAFDAWLTDTCTNTDLNESERKQRLINWQTAPAARYCHPRAEHLIPLHVCYGLAGKPADRSFQMEVMGKLARSFLWE